MSDFNNSIVSIIMPAYNAGKTIGASIESVLAQDYLSWELIIINDCSDDETMDIINNFTTSDSRIKVASLKKNSGISEARNTGIRVAIGRYLAFLDSDDLWKFNKLSRQLEFMATEEHFFTFTGYELMNSNGELLSKTVNAKNRVDYKNLLTNNCIGCLTVIIDRKHIPKIIMPKIKHEDYATWLNILKNDVVAFGLDEPLSIYRVSGSSTSGNKIKVVPWIWKIYRKNQGFGVPKSSLLILANIIKLTLKYIKTGMLKNIIKKQERV